MTERSFMEPAMVLDAPIFVINLDRSDGRLRAMSERLAALGLAFERVPAVEGRALTATELAAACPDRWWWRERRTLTAAEVGCALAHKRALEAALASGAPAALILEDDVLFAKDAVKAIRKAVDGVRGRDAVVKLEGIAEPRDAAARAAEGDMFDLRPQRTPLLGAAAYVVSPGAVKKILTRLVLIDRPFDHVLIEYARNDVELYEVRPFPAWQEESVSTIGDDRDLPEDGRRSQGYRWRKRGWKIAEGVRLRAYWGRRRGFPGWLSGAPAQKGGAS